MTTLRIQHPHLHSRSSSSPRTPGSTRSTEATGRARRVRGARVALTGMTAVVLATGGIGGITVARATPPPATLSIDEVLLDVGAAHIDWPQGVSAAAFEVTGVPGAVGAAGDAAPRPMASIAKLLFALVLLDEKPLQPGEQGPEIALDDDDLAHLLDGMRQGASVLPIAPGDVLTQRQLLEAAMLTSASNATETLADWAFGSEEAYVAAAQQWLAEHGIDGVTVADASGLSDRGVATTAGLLALMDQVDARPAVREISGLATTTLPRAGRVDNTNEALGDAGVDSGKTGALHEHGRTVLAGATRDIAGTPVRIHVALLGIEPGVDRGAATTALVDSVAANLEWLEVLPGATAVAQYDVPWGSPVMLRTTDAVGTLHWRGTPVRVRVDAPSEWAPHAPAALEVAVGDETDASLSAVPLEATGTPSAPDLEWRLRHAAELLTGDEPADSRS